MMEFIHNSHILDPSNETSAIEQLTDNCPLDTYAIVAELAGKSKENVLTGGKTLATVWCENKLARKLLTFLV